MFAPDLENRVILWLQSAGRDLLPLAELFSWLGAGALYLSVFALIYWWSDPRFGLRLFLVLNLSAALNAVLKMALHMPRPYWLDPRIQGIHPHASFGMPSGHAQSAAVVFGLLSVELRRRWVWAACAACVFFIGFSRLNLGVHSPSQVLCGWMLGAAVLVAFVKLEDPLLSWFRRRRPPAQAALCVGAAAALLALGLLIAWMFDDFEFPRRWVDNASSTFTPSVLANPLSMKNLVLSAAAFMGVTVGAVSTSACGGYEPAGPLSARLLRVAVGAIGLFFLFAIFGTFQGEDRWIANLWRFTRTSAAGFWVTGAAPLLFRRLGV